MVNGPAENDLRPLSEALPIQETPEAVDETADKDKSFEWLAEPSV